MRHSFFDRYSRIASPVHRLPVTVKLAITVVLVVTAAATPVTLPAVFAVEIVFLLFIARLSGIPGSFLAKRMLFLELFVGGIAVLSLLQNNGLAVFYTLVLRSSICLFAIVLFSNTTPFAALLETLRRLRFPGLVISILALMYRYLFVLVDEMERMQRARLSRTFVARRSFLWSGLATVIAQSFIRSTERAERIYAAMCSRGWR